MASQIVYNVITKEIIQSQIIPKEHNISDWKSESTVEATLHGLGFFDDRDNYRVAVYEGGDFLSTYARYKFGVSDSGELINKTEVNIQILESVPGRTTIKLNTPISEPIVLLIDGDVYIPGDTIITLESPVPVKFRLASNMQKFFIPPMDIEVM